MTRVEWHGDQYFTAVKAAIDDGLNAWGLRLQQYVRDGLNQGGGAPLSDSYRPSRPGGWPHNFTGTLSRSITLQDARDGNNEAYVGTNVRYAEGLERGIIIRGKGKFLAIPLNPAARRIVRAVGGQSLRTRTDLFFLKAKGKGFLARKRADGSTEFLFVLKESVTIEPRPFLSRGLREDAERGERAFQREARRSIERRVRSLATGGAA